MHENKQLLAALFRGSGRRVEPGAHIFQPGEGAQKLFVLRSGLVELTALSTTGDEVILHLYRPWEIFGELCFVGGVQQFAATALEPSEVLALPRGRVLESLRAEPELFREVLLVLSGRLASTYAELNAFWSDTVLTRLGAKLLDLAGAAEVGADWLELPHRFSHEELAQMVGVRRETVSREMTNLKKRGLIASNRGGQIRVRQSWMRRFLRGEGRLS